MDNTTKTTKEWFIELGYIPQQGFPIMPPPGDPQITKEEYDSGLYNGYLYQ